MNMPTHMAAKPSQRAALVSLSGDSEMLIMASAQFPPRHEAGFFLADAPEQNGRVGERKKDRHRDFVEGERQSQDLTRHHQVIGMADETIGPAPDQWRAGDRNDPCGPIGTEACDHPDARGLQEHENRKPRPGNLKSDRQKPKHRQKPGGVQQHDQGIMGGADFHRALRFQSSGIAIGEHQLAQPLQHHQKDDGVGNPGHRPSSIRKAAEKPGPSAVRRVRWDFFSNFMRSTTNSTVTADMLPKSRSTERLSSRPPRCNSSASSSASSTLAPPGWQAKASISDKAM